MGIKVYSLIVCLLILFALLGGVILSFTLSNNHAAVAEVAPARLIPNTDVNPYGANFFLEREVEDWKRDKTLRMAKEAGIGWVKQQFSWEEIEPSKGVFWDDRTHKSSWLKYDRIVELCQKYGLQIIARLDRPPDWTRRDNSIKQAPPDNFEDYGDFVYNFVKHYQGKIKHIQIWNEPNIYPEWGNREVNPAEYVELLKIAYRRAKEADPNIYVLSAPLAINTENFPIRRNLSDLIYLEEMYQVGAKDYFDILSADAFGMDQPPTAPPAPETLNFSRVLLQREIMERYGDANKPIWFNEYGWNASPADFPPEELIWRRVSEKEQAEYAREGIQLARTQWEWAGVFNIWYFRQPGHISPDKSEYYFRMVDVDFTPRLIYHAIKEAASSLRVARPGVYQETNPAVSTEGGWESVIEPQASAEAYLLSDTPGDSVTFSFIGDKVDLVSWRGPQGGRLQVTLDGRSVGGLPKDAEGQSYVDLYSVDERWQSRMPLIRGASNRQHTLRLTVSGERNPEATGNRCAIDGFEVSVGSSRSFPYYLVGLLLLGMAVVGGLLYRELREGLRKRASSI